LTPMTCRQRRRGGTCQCARYTRCSKTSHATASFCLGYFMRCMHTLFPALPWRLDRKEDRYSLSN
jgi:hypothetical protein